MTAQPNNRFVLCVVVVEFAVNGNQAEEGNESSNSDISPRKMGLTKENDVKQSKDFFIYKIF